MKFLVNGSVVKAVFAFSVFSATANAAVIDQRSGDITVLKVFNTGRAIGAQGIQLDLSQCQTLGNEAGYLRLDCTSVAEQEIANAYPEIASPFAKSVVVYASHNRDGSVTSSFYCRILEIQTLSRRDAFMNADSVGFYFDGGIKHVSRDKMNKIGEATRKNGETADVHRFLGTAFCWQGSMSSSSNASYAFKPFMQFGSYGGDTFRVWDSVDSNYVVGRVGGYSGPWVEGFDRTAELTRVP